MDDATKRPAGAKACPVAVLSRTGGNKLRRNLSAVMNAGNAHSMPKLVEKVLDALQQYADTSNEIAEMIGVPLPNVSATLSDLDRDGVIRKTGRWKRFTNRGPKSWCYELATK